MARRYCPCLAAPVNWNAASRYFLPSLAGLLFQSHCRSRFHMFCRCHIHQPCLKRFPGSRRRGPAHSPILRQCQGRFCFTGRSSSGWERLQHWSRRFLCSPRGRLADCLKSLPEDQRQLVSNVFESSKGSRGTGIGLPVSRKILREHGGRIRIEGGPGEGTRFVLSWPRGNPKEETVRLESPTSVPGE